MTLLLSGNFPVIVCLSRNVPDNKWMLCRCSSKSLDIISIEAISLATPLPDDALFHLPQKSVSLLRLSAPGRFPDLGNFYLLVQRVYGFCGFLHLLWQL